ncbi:MAG TPA: hypothetical protein VNJ70_16985 [Thermoanaerobaculia bacterium]|nr:hypothetical protein [Thermoanaerobaculia bacterium]
MDLRRRFPTVAFALAAWTLVVGLSGPPCREPASCPMDDTAAASTCDGMSSDCCQPAGEKAPQAPGPIALAPVAVAPRAVAELLVFGEASALAEHPPPLAVVRGTGLHTLLAVFLI